MDIGERQLSEPKIGANNFREVSITQQRLRITFNRQKSFANPKREDVTFSAGDLVFLKVSPMKGVMRFDKKRKASSKVHWAI